jgi:xanthine dehydrogenase accessory factor
MLFGDQLAVVRGGGDLASGVVYQLQRAGFPVVVLELDHPLAIRRKVAFASAVSEGRIEIEGIRGQCATTAAEAMDLARSGVVPVLVSPTLPEFGEPASIIVDARIAKRNIDTTIDQAPLVVALGPGFVAGVDCHAVVETKRGHQLGRVIWHGPAEPDSGVPGSVGGQSAERIVRAGSDGIADWVVSIGDHVTKGQTLGRAGGQPVVATTDGVVRGLITPGFTVSRGTKIGDIDPRGDRTACFEISDKARLVGAGVLEVALSWLNEQSG